jgi:hypothetical protein
MADHTRPDLLAGAGILGSHVNNPRDKHIKGLHYFNKYIKETPYSSLFYIESSKKEYYKINLLGRCSLVYCFRECITFL